MGFDVVDLCLFPRIAIPPNFELPTFDKYKGTSCPRSHLAMYCRKMTPYTHDDTLLIHFFQESLTGATLRWYLGLSASWTKRPGQAGMREGSTRRKEEDTGLIQIPGSSFPLYETKAKSPNPFLPGLPLAEAELALASLGPDEMASPFDILHR
ncbi:hypothetical protein CR513_39724, partial [Mucuna pruriens]